MILQKIIELAQEAGNAIMDIYKEGDLEATLKEDQSPLTRADRVSHQIITGILQRMAPGLPVLSEESGAVPYEERKHWRSYWLVDPLDGTKEFINRRDEFTINIALIENGLPVLGVVHAPAMGVTYYAARGEGSFKEEQTKGAIPVRVSDYRHSKLKIAISRLHSGDRIEDFLKKVGDHECISIGSSLKFCLVAEGKAHLYPRLGPTMEWDTAAAQCVVEEAGGSVTDLQGHVLMYNKPDLLNPSFIACGFPPYPWKALLDRN